jgi:hypothetical protein
MKPRHRAGLAGVVLSMVLAGCPAAPAPSTSPSPTPIPATATPTSSATARATESTTSTPVPSPTPIPALSLDLPDELDDRAVRVEVASDLPADADGTITVTVESLVDTMIRELVLRWPEDLHATLFPAPFQPTAERIRDGGPPLVQPWTKWVVGPGERGEPAGTVSLGYGPLPAGGTLQIPMYVTRRADGAVAFDLQVLAGEALLELEGGEPAELRIEVP